MHLKKTKRGERVYLSVVQNYREGGKTKTKTIESIGYVDQFTSLSPTSKPTSPSSTNGRKAKTRPSLSHFRATRPSMTPILPKLAGEAPSRSHTSMR